MRSQWEDIRRRIKARRARGTDNASEKSMMGDLCGRKGCGSVCCCDEGREV
jgi:hypothetical protein